MVVKLNTSHTVFHIKQEIMARSEMWKIWKYFEFKNSVNLRDPEQTQREFSLLSMGPPHKVLENSATVENLIGSVVIQRL